MFEVIVLEFSVLFVFDVTEKHENIGLGLEWSIAHYSGLGIKETHVS